MPSAWPSWRRRSLQGDLLRGKDSSQICIKEARDLPIPLSTLCLSQSHYHEAFSAPACAGGESSLGQCKVEGDGGEVKDCRDVAAVVCHGVYTHGELQN